MEFRRILTGLVLLFFSSYTFATNPGIAFVHGTKDHRDDAYGIYWKIDFIDSVAQGLAHPENVLVTHCDFSQYMWDSVAGDCTAAQLIEFIDEKKITSLIVYTHSNGGNVMRWILSNPTYNADYLRLQNIITQVIALAPSSAGTSLADLALSDNVISSNLSWLLGYQGNAIKQQRVTDMQIYNQELLFGTQGRPSLPVRFRSIIGTDVVASPFNSESYCNGYILNSGLKLTKLYLDSCADGFLNCSSQGAAGEIWFQDKELLANKTLSHNQSRHSCNGLEQILAGILRDPEVAS
ncbi:MAG: hypothetical protein BGO90_14405 [Legionella sp. 40-6]|nr:hypothetical protein [Legionella sp.]OJY26220.1 MAG: hypothetical protein BGO90_14405 [Legionella sp. 40-6]